MNFFEICIRVVIIGGLVLFGYMGFDYFSDDTSARTIDPSGDDGMIFVVEEPEYIPAEITYNISELTENVIEEFKQYFTIEDYRDFALLNDGWWQESGYMFGYKSMRVGTYGIENDSDRYRLVFTHEYFHYALHEMNLTKGELHEALADLYTRYTNKEEQIEIWGEENKGRNYPYNIITNKVIEKDEDCLNKVFDKNKKMKNVKEILNRLEVYCGVDLIEVLNEI